MRRRELREHIFKLLFMAEFNTTEEMPEQLRGKYQYYTCADTKKLREAGYEAEFTSLEDGAAKYVAYLNSIQ